MARGYRQFTRETLASSVVQDYLMDQAVMRFDSDSQRSAQLTAPETGMVSYIEDEDRLELRSSTGVWRYVSSRAKGALTDADAVPSMSGQWTRVSATLRDQGNGWGYLLINVTRAGGALTLSTNGALSDTLWGTIAAGYAPMNSVPLQSRSGRPAFGRLDTDRTVTLFGLGGTQNLATGDALNLCGQFRLAAFV